MWLANCAAKMKIVLKQQDQSMGLMSKTCCSETYPMVNVYITMENHLAIHGKTHCFYGAFP